MGKALALALLMLPTMFGPASGQTTMSLLNPPDCYADAAKLVKDIRASGILSAQLDRYENGKFDGQAGTFFDANRPVLDKVRQGAASPTCAWTETDMQARLDTLRNLRDLFNFMLAHARYSLQQKDNTSAVDDALTDLALSRHIAMDHLLVDELVSISCEYSDTDFLATALLPLTPEELHSLLNRLDRLPPVTTGAELMNGEEAFARKRATEQGVTLVVMVDGMEPFYHNLGVAMEQSPADFAKVVDEQTTKLALNPYPKILGPAIVRAQQQMAALAAKRAMLRAAIDILIHGESAVATSHDPYGTEPFEYKKTPGGFELSSTLSLKGKPVRLTVGN